MEVANSNKMYFCLNRRRSLMLMGWKQLLGWPLCNGVQSTFSARTGGFIGFTRKSLDFLLINSVVEMVFYL